MTTGLLGTRLQMARNSLAGNDDTGIESIARRLNIPADTWRNYEKGVTMPAQILLAFIDLGVEWRFLWTGNAPILTPGTQRYQWRDENTASFQD
jgi:hypothetical protein